MEFFRFTHYHAHKTVDRANIEQNRVGIGKLLIFACFFLYTASMAAKGVFAAETQYVKDLFEIVDYSLVSLTNTFYFVTYGIVQVVLFFLVKRLNVRKYMICTVPFAAIALILMGFAKNIYTMWIFFGLTGALQAGIYCGCNYMLTENLPAKMLSSANKAMNVGYAVGTVTSYGLCALCVSFDLWYIPYFVFGGLFLVAVVFFASIVKLSSRYKKINELLDKREYKKLENLDEKPFTYSPLFTIENKKKVSIFYVISLSLAFFITCLYYMVMNYISPLLVEVHGLGQDVAIFITMLAPAGIVLGPIIAINLCDRDRNFIRQALFFLFSLLPLSILLAFFYNKNVILALALAIVYVIIANGVKAIILSVMMFKMKNYINVGAFSAISNAVASIAAGVAPTVTGAIIDSAGWQASYFTITALIVVLIVVITVINIIVNKKHA